MLTITLLGGFSTEDARSDAWSIGQERLLCQDATQLLMPSASDIMLHRVGQPSRHVWLELADAEHAGCIPLPEDGLYYGSIQVTNPAGGVGVRLGDTMAAPLIGPFQKITLHYGIVIDLIPPINPHVMIQYPPWWPCDHAGRLRLQRVDWTNLTAYLTGWPLPTTRLQMEPWPTPAA